MKLTDREQEIISLVALGMTNQKIAEQLFIEVTTLRSHLKNIINKVGHQGINNRMQLVRWAVLREMDKTTTHL